MTAPALRGFSTACRLLTLLLCSYLFKKPSAFQVFHTTVKMLRFCSLRWSLTILVFLFFGFFFCCLFVFFFCGLASDSQRSTLLCLLNAQIKGVPHHAWLLKDAASLENIERKPTINCKHTLESAPRFPKKVQLLGLKV